MKKEKYLFIDRDGTLIKEPFDYQIDSVDKLEFLPGVFNALFRFQNLGYKLVMISNQDGLGSDSLPMKLFLEPHNLMLKIFKSQGIEFSDIKICPHFQDDLCDCRKPKIGLVLDYLKTQCIDRQNSFVIGDRSSDIMLAENIGIKGILIGASQTKCWQDIVNYITKSPRTAELSRKTNETNIDVNVNLDIDGNIHVNTGIGFFDHMLEQLIKHAGMSATIEVKGDTFIDDHHSVEDTALVLGECIQNALGDKCGVSRYGFLLPMDESLTKVAIDLSGRPFCRVNADFKRDKIGGLSSEMISHFFNSFSYSLQATIHIDVTGNNTHHMIEAIFKAMGRALRQAIKRDSGRIPSTKGVL